MQKFNYFGEIRSIGTESRVVEGRALSFGIESTIVCEDGLYFTETLQRGCITEDVLNKSNVIMTYNHDRSQILARSNKRKGSLNLELKEDGLYFSTEVPHTRFGDEMLELIKRGDVCSCSFAFYVNEDSLIWNRNPETGILHRTVTEITELTDVAAVIDPAYCFNDATYISARSAELDAAIRALDEKKEDEKEEEEDGEDPKDCEESEDYEESEDRESTETPKEEETESDSEENEEDEKEEINNNEKSSEKEDSKKRNNTKINLNHNIMTKKNITVGEQIRSAYINGEKMVNVNLSTRSMTVTGDPANVSGVEKDPYAVGETTVQEEYQSLIEPLYESDIVSKMGIKMFTGAPKGTYNFPIIGKGTVGFAKEIAKAVESHNVTTNVKMSPNRVAGYVDISKELILTDTVGVFDAIRRSLYDAVAEYLQYAILDDAAKSDERPAGLLNGAEVKSVANFKDLCNLEATLQDAHFDNIKYVVSNKAYAALRNMPKSTKTTQLVLEDDHIDAVPVIRTGALKDSKIVLGDFSNIVAAVWDNAQITIDDTSLAVYGMVRLVVNAYVDWAVIRPESFVVATIA